MATICLWATYVDFDFKFGGKEVEERKSNKGVKMGVQKTRQEAQKSLSLSERHSSGPRR